MASTNRRWTEEQKSWYFKNIVDAGIPRTSNKAREMLKEKYGVAPSKATLQYWTVPEEKQKVRARSKKYRKENVFIIVGGRLDAFRQHTPAKIEKISLKTSKRIQDRGKEKALDFTIKSRIARFHAKGTKMSRLVLEDCTFLAKDLLEHMETTQKYNPETHDCTCLICGDSLNLVNDIWHLDHIDPQGPNTLENASCVHAECNQLKAALTMEQLLKLTEKITDYHKSKI